MPKPNSVRANDDSFEVETDQGVILHILPLHASGENKRYPRQFALTVDWMETHLGMPLSYQDLRILREWLCREMNVV